MAEENVMGKIKENLMDLMQKGKSSFADTPDNANDAHGEDDRKITQRKHLNHWNKIKQPGAINER